MTESPQKVGKELLEPTSDVEQEMTTSQVLGMTMTNDPNIESMTTNIGSRKFKGVTGVKKKRLKKAFGRPSEAAAPYDEKEDLLDSLESPSPNKEQL